MIEVGLDFCAVILGEGGDVAIDLGDVVPGVGA